MAYSLCSFIAIGSSLPSRCPTFISLYHGVLAKHLLSSKRMPYFSEEVLAKGNCHCCLRPEQPSSLLVDTSSC